MLIPLSWAVSKAAAMPERERKRTDEGGWGVKGRWSECVQNRDGEESGS